MKLGLSSKALTEELRRLAAEAHTVKDDGTPVTRHQALAELIWKYALGWSEKKRNPVSAIMEEVSHPPVAWAMQFMWERLEGKAAPATIEEGGHIKALDKIRDLSRNRLNAMAAGKPAGPPTHKAKGPSAC